MQPKVSVIIPCYNHGKFIDDAVASVLAQTYPDIEIVIVDDASEDQLTREKLANYKQDRTQVIILTKNVGLPEARNTAIRTAKGKYILPLDADDKIAPTYVAKAVALMEQNENCGIVRCYTQTFGDENWKAELSYDFEKMLATNLLVATSMFRKQDWERVGGYKTSMKYGYEDYDFWLSIIEMGRDVLTIPEILFFYRKLNTTAPQQFSLKSMDSNKKLAAKLTIIENHKQLYQQNVPALIKYIHELELGITSRDHKLAGYYTLMHKLRFLLPLIRLFKRNG